MRPVAKALGALVLLSEHLAALCILCIALMVSVDVGIRWTTGHPITGVFEISGVMLVAVTMLAMPAVLYRDQQLRVDILYEQAGPRLRRFIVLADCIIGAIAFALLTQGGWEETWKAFSGGFLQRGMIAIPTWLPNALITFGVGLSLLVLLLRLIATCLGRSLTPNDTPPAVKER